MHTVVLGLGSNMGERQRYLQEAVGRLRAFMDGVRCSAIYESPALLPDNAPAEWNMPYLNMAVRGKTALGPLALLAEIKAVEQALGRKPREHWGPREIDIDIWAYGDETVREPSLTVPHIELLRRDFALIPLAELTPDWVHPAAGGRTARDLACAMTSALVKTNIIIL